MVVTSSSLAVGTIGETLSENADPSGGGGDALVRALPQFADDLAWWTQAARAQRERCRPPY